MKSFSDIGLTSAEAQAKLVEHGANVTDGGKKKSFAKKFFGQFGDLMIIILIVAAVLSFVVAIYNNRPSELLEPLIIVGIVFANAFLGAFQEFRAEKSLLALQKLTKPTTKVVRDGSLAVVDSALVVPQDVCLFEAGDVVTADCKLLLAQGLMCDESALTGESVPVFKRVGSGKQGKIFSGSLVAKGRCYAVVTETGNKTELGKIAKMLSDSSESLTPLQQRMKQLSKVIGAVCLAVCGAVLVIGFVKGVKHMQRGDTLVGVFTEVFLTSVSLAVAAIPEGLPAVVTVVLARGIEKMATKNAVVKRLTAVEALGSATVICSDKTGTLTQNKMTLTGLFDGNAFVSADKLPQDNLFLRAFCWCCDSKLNADGEWIGDPTEIAVAKLCPPQNVTRLYEIPFDSERKMMTVVVQADGKYYAVTKGSPDSMACSASLFATHYHMYTRKGLRVLALCLREVSSNFPRSQALERNLNVSALFTIADPPRTEAADAVALCKTAGIRPVMITGDSVETATEIARRIGIMSDTDLATDGETLAEMSENELSQNVDKIAVYARVSPSDKLKIVKAWQANNAVVAMTGDGVNDAPALKYADIGCAMGSGTEVAKNAADIILTDDNFATVVDAVSLGRSVYQNIKKTVTYLLTCNIGEVLSVFVALLVWNASPLAAMQLLWINLVTDGLPGLALGVYKQEQNVMKRPPIGRNEGFFGNGGGIRVAVGGVLFAAATLAAFAVGLRTDYDSACTMAYLALSLSQLFFVLEMRAENGLFDKSITPFMVVCIVVSVALVWIVALIPPFATLFGLAKLHVWQYFVATALALLPLVCYELRRMAERIVGFALAKRSAKSAVAKREQHG